MSLNPQQSILLALAAFAVGVFVGLREAPPPSEGQASYRACLRDTLAGGVDFGAQPMNASIAMVRICREVAGLPNVKEPKE